MRCSPHCRLAAAWMLLVGLAGAALAQETAPPSSGFGYVARLHAALTEKKAGETADETKACKECVECEECEVLLECEECEESSDSVFSPNGLLRIFSFAAAPACSTPDCAQTTGAVPTATPMTCVREGEVFNTIVPAACGTAQCWKTVQVIAAKNNDAKVKCDGERCTAENCSADHCALHGCAAACDATECPAACSLHECPESQRATYATRPETSAAESICKTKSCARLTAAGADCCCKDGGDCGCQADATVHDTTVDAEAHKSSCLLKAAELLEEAGLTVHAKEVRAHAEREQRAKKEALLARKSAELAKLQAEIEAIAKELAGPQQVVIDITVIELPKGQFAPRGLDLGAIVRSRSVTPSPADTDEPPVEEVTCGVFDNNSIVLHYIHSLENNQLLKVLANPRMVTLSGQCATFNSGGEFPIVVSQPDGGVGIEYCEFGTRVTVRPIVIADDEFQLEINPRITEVGKSKSEDGAEGRVNSLRVRFDASTTAKLKHGQTLVMVDPAGEDENRPGMLVLASAKLAKGSEAGHVAPATYTPAMKAYPVAPAATTIAPPELRRPLSFAPSGLYDTPVAPSAATQTWEPAKR